jgi:hypothetical protein
MFEKLKVMNSKVYALTMRVNSIGKVKEIRRQQG